MKGLILKDILFVKNFSKMIFVLVIAFAIMGYNGDGYSIAFYLPFIAIMISLTTFNYDTFNNWDTYLLSFPIKRKEIVKAKYIFAFLTVILSMILAFLFVFLTMCLKQFFVFDGMLLQFGVGLFTVLLVISFTYPLIYKFGSEKGRIWLFVIFFGIGAVLCLFGYIMNALHITIPYHDILPFIKTYGISIGGVIMLFLFYLSYKISCHIYEKKEF